MAEKKRLFWSAVGSVRGDCGHMHRTIRGAAECVLRDRRACRRLPGGASYSDRVVVAMWGTPAVAQIVEPSAEQADEIDRAMHGES